MQYKAVESRSVSVNPKRGSPRTKSTPRESTLFGGKFYVPVKFAWAFRYIFIQAGTIQDITGTSDFLKQIQVVLSHQEMPFLFSLFIWMDSCRCYKRFYHAMMVRCSQSSRSCTKHTFVANFIPSLSSSELCQQNQIPVLELHLYCVY